MTCCYQYFMRLYDQYPNLQDFIGVAEDQLVDGLPPFIDHLLEQIDTSIEQWLRSLILTMTKKSAEEISNFMLSKGYKTFYLHSEVDTIDRREIIKIVGQARLFFCCCLASNIAYASSFTRLLMGCLGLKMPESSSSSPEPIMSWLDFRPLSWHREGKLRDSVRPALGPPEPLWLYILILGLADW